MGFQKQNIISCVLMLICAGTLIDILTNSNPQSSYRVVQTAIACQTPVVTPTPNPNREHKPAILYLDAEGKVRYGSNKTFYVAFQTGRTADQYRNDAGLKASDVWDKDGVRAGSNSEWQNIDDASPASPTWTYTPSSPLTQPGEIKADVTWADNNDPAGTQDISTDTCKIVARYIVTVSRYYALDEADFSGNLITVDAYAGGTLHQIQIKEDFDSLASIEGSGKLENPYNGYSYVNRWSGVWHLGNGILGKCGALTAGQSLAITTGWSWTGNGILGGGDSVSFELPPNHTSGFGGSGTVVDTGSFALNQLDLYVGPQHRSYVAYSDTNIPVTINRANPRGCP